MRFANENEIFALVRSFEEATIRREDWKHAEHLTVALVYLTEHGMDRATDMMRSGIFNLLKIGFNIDFAKEMPYHETLTVFWMRAVANFDDSVKTASILDKANELIATCNKDLPLRSYTRELLFSELARTTFVEPDILNMPIDRSCL